MGSAMSWFEYSRFSRSEMIISQQLIELFPQTQSLLFGACVCSLQPIRQLIRLSCAENASQQVVPFRNRRADVFLDLVRIAAKEPGRMEDESGLPLDQSYRY
jgi:hypothetical protein